MHTPADYMAMLPYATDRQGEAVRHLVEQGSFRKAAKAMGITERPYAALMERLRAQAARAGHSPVEDRAGLAADGYYAFGKSIYYKETPDTPAHWLRTRVDHQAMQNMLRDAINAFYEDLQPIRAPKGPKRYDKDIIPWFQIGDAHLGMLAHDAETGANFDLKIAERELSGAFSILFDEAMDCERCVINDLGDFTHYENLAGITEASGNMLDYDGRFPKMIRVYSRVFRSIVEMALRKYRFVDVIVNQGNHSRTNDWWMAELLRAAYGKSGRLNVLDNDNVFVPYRMGETFVLVHHGDKTKPENLSKVMSTDFRQDWGETKYHYIDVGHLHHRNMAIEMQGCTVECWNTLAGRDKWTNDIGARAVQSITRVDRSRTYGDVGRRVLPIDEIRKRMNLPACKEVYVPPERREVFTV